MIKYSLICKDGHEFESWFQNSATFEREQQAQRIGCPACSSHAVSKAIMAPAIARRRDATVRDDLAALTPPAELPSAVAPTKEDIEEFKHLVRALRDEVRRRAEYVGPNFAEEARRIHYQEREARAIYGEATISDVRELRDEGISVFHIPRLPEDHN